MNLNKAMKEQLINDLIGQACKKKAGEMGAAANKVLALWEALVTERVAQAIPELTPDRWIELIQHGAMVSHSSGSGHLSWSRYTYPLNSKDGKKYTFNTQHKEVGAIGGVYPNKERDKRTEFLRPIKAAYSVFCSVFDVSAAYNNYNVRFDPNFARLPWVKGSNTVFEQAVSPRDEDPIKLAPSDVYFSQKAWPIMEQAEALAKMFVKVIDEAEKLKETLETVIMPMKTAKQLIDAMPEAAKFLPEPAPKRQELAPKEYIENARRMLAEGIPT